MTTKIVYQIDVKNPTYDKKKFYLGVTETPFKEHLGNHTQESNTLNTEITWSNQNIYGNSKMLIYQLLNGVFKTPIYTIKNLNWVMLVIIKANCYQKVLKGINTVREAML